MTHLREVIGVRLGLGVGRAGTVAIDAVTAFLLMRLCGPEVAGTFALGTTLATAFASIGDAGTAQSLLSDTRRGPSRAGAALVVGMAAAVVVAVTAVAATPLLTLFGSDVAGLTVSWYAAMTGVAMAILSQLPIAIGQHEGRFQALAIIPLFSAAVSSGAAVLVATATTDVTPLVTKLLMGGIANLSLSWLVLRPTIGRPARADFRAVLRWGRGQTAFSLLNYLNRNADNLVVSRYLGEVALGVYSAAYRVLLQPIALVSHVVQTVEHPRLAKLAPDWVAVARGLADVMRRVSHVTTPLCFGIAIGADDLVRVVLGPAWLDAVAPLRILALLGIYQAPISLTGLAYQVSRRTDQMAAWGLLATPAIVLSFFAGVPWGVTGVAASYALTSLALAVPILRLSARVLGVSPLLLARGPALGWLESLAGCAFMGACYGIGFVMGASAEVRLLLVVVAGMLVLANVIRRISAETPPRVHAPADA